MHLYSVFNLARRKTLPAMLAALTAFTGFGLRAAKADSTFNLIQNYSGPVYVIPNYSNPNTPTLSNTDFNLVGQKVLKGVVGGQPVFYSPTEIKDPSNNLNSGTYQVNIGLLNSGTLDRSAGAEANDYLVEDINNGSGTQNIFDSTWVADYGTMTLSEPAGTTGKEYWYAFYSSNPAVSAPTNIYGAILSVTTTGGVTTYGDVKTFDVANTPLPPAFWGAAVLMSGLFLWKRTRKVALSE